MLAHAFVVAHQSDPWSVLGDGSRRAIVERLSVGACTVADLAGEMPISRPAVSQHLKELKDAGVVQDRGFDGSVCRWGRGLVLDSHETIPFSWTGWRIYLARYQALTRGDEVFV